MSRSGATVSQADIARTIRAARQAGARSVEVRFPDGTTLLVRLSDTVETADAPLVPHEEIVL